MTRQADSEGTPRRAQGRVGRAPRFRVWRAVAGGVGLLAVVGMLWPMLPGSAAPEAAAGTAGASESSSARRVDVVRPESGGIRRLTIQPGTIHAFESVDLFAKVSGFLKTQKVDIGSPVKRGDVLAEIDAPELSKDVEEAEAAVERAKAQVEQAEARIATAEAERATAVAALAEAGAEVERRVAGRALSDKQLERIRDLHAQRAVGQNVVDEQQHDQEAARATERAARAAQETARAHTTAAEAKIRQAKADAVEARAAAHVAEAHRDRARVLADYTRIVAPFDGVVTHRSFHPGAFIRSATEGATTPLLTVRRTDLVRVVVQVPDLDVPLLDVGDKATVVVDALKSREFTGTVARLGQSEDPASRTMRAEIDLPNPSGRLVEGMYGRATIVLQPANGALTVPAGCVVGYGGHGSESAAIYVVREGKAHRTPVVLGADDGRSVEILSGLEPGAEVIVRPGSALDDGTAVAATLISSQDAARR